MRVETNVEHELHKTVFMIDPTKHCPVLQMDNYSVGENQYSKHVIVEDSLQSEHQWHMICKDSTL